MPPLCLLTCTLLRPCPCLCPLPAVAAGPSGGALSAGGFGAGAPSPGAPATGPGQPPLGPPPVGGPAAAGPTGGGAGGFGPPGTPGGPTGGALGPANGGASGPSFTSSGSAGVSTSIKDCSRPHLLLDAAQAAVARRKSADAMRAARAGQPVAVDVSAVRRGAYVGQVRPHVAAAAWRGMPGLMRTRSRSLVRTHAHLAWG